MISSSTSFYQQTHLLFINQTAYFQGLENSWPLSYECTALADRASSFYVYTTISMVFTHTHTMCICMCIGIQETKTTPNKTPQQSHRKFFLPFFIPRKIPVWCLQSHQLKSSTIVHIKTETIIQMSSATLRLSLDDCFGMKCSLRLFSLFFNNCGLFLSFQFHMHCILNHLPLWDSAE